MCVCVCLSIVCVRVCVYDPLSHLPPHDDGRSVCVCLCTCAYVLVWGCAYCAFFLFLALSVSHTQTLARFLAHNCANAFFISVSLSLAPPLSPSLCFPVSPLSPRFFPLYLPTSLPFFNLLTLPFPFSVFASVFQSVTLGCILSLSCSRSLSTFLLSSFTFLF